MQKLFSILFMLALPAMAGAGFANGKNGAPEAKPAVPRSGMEKDIALVLKTTGQVQINADNGGWLNAPKGTRLSAGTQVRTGNESLAAIIFTDDRSLLKVRSNSQVMINGKRETAAASGRIVKNIAMQFGELWAKVTKGSAPFRVETPSGVAAVKGTIFYAIITADGKFLIVCLDGLVELINQYGKALVKAGETGISSADEAPESHPTTPDEMPNWANDSEGNGDIEIEFQDGNGQKKKLKIRYQ